MKGAIIGFGDVAEHGHWPAYAASPELSIAAVVDRTASRRRAAEALAPGMPTYATVDELAAAETLDFVDICTPPAFHHEPMLEALGAGWHVLCEKPFIIDAHALETVRRRATAASRSVVPVHNWKYAPIVRRATELLRAGTIGRLRRVDIETTRVRACPTAETDHPNWRRDPALAGGGILMDHGWHAAYLALHWFEERAVDVSASLLRPTPDEVEEEASVTVTFPSGRAAIALTWNGDLRRNTMRLTGDRGRIVVDDGTLRVETPTGCDTTDFDRALSDGSHHEDWFAAMLPDVTAAFRDRQAAGRLFDEAAECLRVIHLAYRTASPLAAARQS
jgi:predicted dehydrogenase